ncbi:hypothetical protein I7I51_01049 [Histoplasma capsulatum]|uniref:Uncharacterized protein n=1 Tax=Ajellomyces capsulatus TaxID=5037 RepID=A0A8A1MBN4_AJECA|nr:hypothetical protein I7I51_01049 [Histoplasma capsulatum]
MSSTREILLIKITPSTPTHISASLTIRRKLVTKEAPKTARILETNTMHHHLKYFSIRFQNLSLSLSLWPS